MEKQVYDLIVEVQQNNQESILEILRKFDPLLKRAAFRLCREDAFEDFRIWFLDMISKIDVSKLKNKSDGGLVVYFKKSVENKLIAFQKEKQIKSHTYGISDLSQQELLDFERVSSKEDSHDELFFRDIQKYLTATEYKIIYAIYVGGKRPSDIARQLGITRQTVNETKLNALKKLRRSLHNI